MEGTNWAAVGAVAFSIFSNMVSGVAWFFAWQARRERASAKEVAQLRQSINDLKTQLATTPSAATTQKIALDLSEMSGNLKALGAEMNGVTTLLERIDKVVTRHEEHLLQQAGRQ